jgi:hypothetical protein
MLCLDELQRFQVILAEKLIAFRKMAIGRKRVMKKSQELNNKKRNDAALFG